jgi:hypothetical protein
MSEEKITPKFNMNSSPTKQDLEKLPHNKQVLFACFCAERVMYLVREEHKAVCMRAIQAAYLFLEGKATKEDCRAAAHAAHAAYAASAAYAAYAASAAADAASADAAHAAYAASADAAHAAYAASAASAASAAKSSSSVIEAQWDYYDQLLNTDKHFEEIVLEQEWIS